MSTLRNSVKRKEHKERAQPYVAPRAATQQRHERARADAEVAARAQLFKDAEGRVEVVGGDARVEQRNRRLRPRQRVRHAARPPDAQLELLIVRKGARQLPRHAARRNERGAHLDGALRGRVVAARIDLLTQRLG